MVPQVEGLLEAQVYRFRVQVRTTHYKTTLTPLLVFFNYILDQPLQPPFSLNLHSSLTIGSVFRH